MPMPLGNQSLTHFFKTFCNISPLSFDHMAFNTPHGIPLHLYLHSAHHILAGKELSHPFISKGKKNRYNLFQEKQY